MKLSKLVFVGTSSLLVCVFLLFLVRYDSHPAHATDDTQPKIHILFIGNSYTFVNNLPLILETLSAHEAKPIVAESVTEGGATLEKHWQEGKALAAIRKGNWNYVVLQEHSTFGSTAVVDGVAQLNDPINFYKYARLFDTEIKKVGAKTLFYMTWARQNSPKNQAIIAKTYTTIANELQDEVVPVGLAWANSLKAQSTLILHQVDKSHPNPDGSFLAACVFYSELYDKVPPVPADLSSLDAHDASYLSDIAWQTVEQQNEQVDGLVNKVQSVSLP